MCILIWLSHLNLLLHPIRVNWQKKFERSRPIVARSRSNWTARFQLEF